MSDLYLVLRNRLEAVPEWVFIDTGVLRAGRERKGLSYETTARELHVSAKTYERYEKAGRIPRPLLRAVADLFDLEIEEPRRERVVPRLAEEEGNADVRARLERIEQLLVALDRKWDEADLRARLALLEREISSVARVRD